MSETPTIPQQLKAIRKQKGLTLIEAAKLSGMTASYISEIENGIYCPTLAILGKLLTAYNYELKITRKKNGQQKKADS